MFKAEGVDFTHRRYHPSPDPVNAVLSFGYALLTSSLHSLLDAVGFDPFLGFFHTESYGRPSLALDLIEPYRAPVVDRFAVRLFNLRMLKPDDFESDGEGGVQLGRSSIRVFFREYERQLARLDVRRCLKEQVDDLRKVFLGEQELLAPYIWRARQ
jgi:CRISPR-associated protein Cas1